MKYVYYALIAYTICEWLAGYWASSLLFWSIAVITHIIIITVKRNKKRNTKEEIKVDNAIYHRKQFLTNREKEFYNKLKLIYKNKYIIQAQVPLRMIIDKDLKSEKEYSNELHKYIDFGIFTKNHELLVLIELNDRTHLEEDRIIRDKKVKEICRQAQIPIIEFWTNSTDIKEIKQIIDKELK